MTRPLPEKPKPHLTGITRTSQREGGIAVRSGAKASVWSRPAHPAKYRQYWDAIAGAPVCTRALSQCCCSEKPRRRASASQASRQILSPERDYAHQQRRISAMLLADPMYKQGAIARGQQGKGGSTGPNRRRTRGIAAAVTRQGAPRGALVLRPGPARPSPQPFSLRCNRSPGRYSDERDPTLLLARGGVACWWRADGEAAAQLTPADASRGRPACMPFPRSSRAMCAVRAGTP